MLSQVGPRQRSVDQDASERAMLGMGKGALKWSVSSMRLMSASIRSGGQSARSRGRNPLAALMGEKVPSGQRSW